VASSGGDGEAHFDARVLQEDELVLECGLPIDHVFIELGAIALFAGMLEFVERHVFGVEQTAVPGKEVVADRLMHVVLPAAARSLRAGATDDTATLRRSPDEPLTSLSGRADMSGA
jgi:hypothetical protein